MIRKSSGFKVSPYAYDKYAILCKATVVFPLPATPCTIIGFPILALMILFCSV